MSTDFLKVGIVADDKTSKGIRSAKQNISGFEKTVEKFGKTFASIFAAQKVIDFGKASAKAFMEDQKSAALLANTVKNLGLAFAQPEIDGFIKKLEDTSGVVDEKLRPSMQKLLTTTGSIAKSQELLTNAIDISRGSGVDLATVTQDLANAYVGNTRGLKKYNLGLTQAQLKAASFTDIQKKLNDQFGGASQAYLKTYAGQMELLATASDNAKEAIGKGLVDSLALLAGDKGVQNIADGMKSFAEYTSNAIYGLSTLIYKLENAKIPSWFQKLLDTAPGKSQFGVVKGITDYFANIGAKAQNSKLQNPSVSMFLADQAKNRVTAEQTKKFQQTLIKNQKNLTAEQKKQAALKKAQGVFDLQQIQLVAALKGQLSDEDKKRVEAQLALLNDNEVLAKKLTDQIIAAQDPTGQLGKMLKDLGDTTVKNPFADWLKTVQAINDQIAIMKSLSAATAASVPAATMPAGSVNANGFAYSSATPGVSGSASQFGSGTPWAQAAQNFTVSVQVDGKEIASALANTSASGTSSFIDRNLGYFTN